MPAVNEDKLNQFVFKALGDLGATMSSVLVMLGDRLGLYKAMKDAGPLTPAELAKRTRTAERYIREWLLNQAAGGYVEYDAKSGKYTLPPEQAMVLADEHSPVFMQGGFQVCAAVFHDATKTEEGFRTGNGVDWGDHHQCLFEGTERFFRPSYEANLIGSWIPALDGVKARLERGAVVADVGCGHGASTILMAKAFPKSAFIGFDYHAPSIDHATTAAEAAGVSANCSFGTAKSTDFPAHSNGSRMKGRAGAANGSGGDYDLICCFDCLHDMGDPVGAAAQVRRRLTPEGTWLIVEPFARDRLEDNLNPIGRCFSAASTLVCVPASLASNGPALGAQAGEARLREVVTKGGFTRFRRATQTPFNLILEARP